MGQALVKRIAWGSFALVVALDLLSPARAQDGGLSASRESPFNGTWRANNGSMQYQGSNHYSLLNGIWRCDSCVPEIAIKADGHYHAIKSSLYFGAAYADTESIREVNDRSIEITDKLKGRVVARNKLTTSEDGKTLTTGWSAISNSGNANSGTFDSERTGGAPAGANKVSGEWHPIKTNTTEDEVTVTYKVTADGLAMSDPPGDSYTAKFDGNEYPFRGDPGITSVSLKKIDEYTTEETDMRNGKVVAVCHMTIERDGKTMKVTVEDKTHNAKISWTAHKL